MKIKDVKSVKLLKRCLATEQLRSYANLCKTMDTFDDLYRSEASKIDDIKSFDAFFDPSATEKEVENPVDTLLEQYLPKAAAGDLSFMTSEAYIQKMTDFSTTMQEKIDDSFKRYAFFSKRLSDFKSSDRFLDNILKENGSISKEDLNYFKSHMQKTSKTTKKFMEDFDKHSKTYLGHKYYMLTTRALSDIALTHPEISSAKAFSKITPETYDTSIRGFYRTAAHSVTLKALSEYKDKKPNTWKELLSVAGAKFRENKPKIRALSAAALLAGGIATGMTAMNVAKDLSDRDITIYEAVEKNYPLHISQETFDKISNIRENLNAIENSSELPQKSQLVEIRDALDETMDDIFSDLVKDAFEKKYPENTVQRVETAYDKSAPEETPQTTITIDYLDKNQTAKTKVISTFDTKHFLVTMAQGIKGNQSNIQGTFDIEMSLDNDFGKLLNKAYDNDLEGGNSFDKKSVAIKDVLGYLGEKLETLETIGAQQMTYGQFLWFGNLSFEPTPKDTSSKATQTQTQAPTSKPKAVDEDREL